MNLQSSDRPNRQCRCRDLLRSPSSRSPFRHPSPKISLIKAACPCRLRSPSPADVTEVTSTVQILGHHIPCCGAPISRQGELGVEPEDALPANDPALKNKHSFSETSSRPCLGCPEHGPACDGPTEI